MLNAIGIIPCRMESSRLPGKPLALIWGTPMIELVYHAACKSNLSQVFVATDSGEIRSVIQAIGGEVIMTSPAHKNGTTRIAEAAYHLRDRINHNATIVDIQGDDPLVSPDRVNELVEAHGKRRAITVSVGDLSETCRSNPNIVKVVEGHLGRVQTMTRSPDFPHQFRPGIPLVYKHLSTIAFSYASLQEFASLPECEQERMEGIELLRAVYYGIPVYTHHSLPSPSVDTQEDLEYVRSIFPRGNT
jgi:3-deoxy-manno-octulosonate cytidylyltransferase (CMP-KDO synthetase)